MAKERLDKYYTPKKEIERFGNLLLQELEGVVGLEFIEPSAGDGRWVDYFNGHDLYCVGYDLSPDRSDIIEQDFLKLKLPSSNGVRVFVGNPPFGKANSLSVKFFNHCAALGADVIAMILPSSFGIKLQNRARISKDFSLYSCTPMESGLHFDLTTDKKYEGINRMKCSFMIWVRKGRNTVDIPDNAAYTIVRPPNNKILVDGVSKELGVGELNVDFSIITHGTLTGKVLDFSPEHKVSVKQFVKVNEGYDAVHWRKVFSETDFSYFTNSSLFSGSQSSISSSEIKCCVELSGFKLDELKKKGYALQELIRQGEK